MLWALASLCTLMSELVFCSDTYDFFLSGKIFAYGVSTLCCRLEWIPVPRPVQWVVIAAVTFNWYGCEAWVSAVFQSVLKVRSFPSHIFFYHLHHPGTNLTPIALQSGVGWGWTVEGQEYFLQCGPHYWIVH